MNEVRIFNEARISKNEFKGIPVKESFYTAGLPDGTSDRYIAAVNHSETYVMDGKKWGIEPDILVRTGNGLAEIEPEILIIEEAIHDGDFAVYKVKELPDEYKTRILDELDLMEDYKLTYKLKGLKPLGQRILEVMGTK